MHCLNAYNLCVQNSLLLVFYILRLWSKTTYACLEEECLKKQGVSIGIGRGEDFSVMAIPSGDVPRESEASEL